MSFVENGQGKILEKDGEGNPIKISGYKSFNYDGTTCFGNIMLPNIKYHADGKIKFGVTGNGYHFAKRLEDTLRYSSKMKSILRDYVIAEVIGSGVISCAPDDDYYGYYDLYSASDIEIVKYLTREEILDLALTFDDFRLCRFLKSYYLSKKELEMFIGKSYYVDYEMIYYQNEKYRQEYIKEKEKIKSLSTFA